MATSGFTCAKSRDAYYHNELGFKYQQNGEYNKALEEYLLAIDENNNYFAAQNNIGTIYYILENYEKSIYHYDKALNIDPNSYASHYSKALAILALLDKANKTENIKAKSNRKYELTVIKNDNISLNQAITELEIAEKLSKSNPTVQIALGTAYFKNNQKDKASEKFKNVLKNNPLEPVANFYTGLTLQKSGNYNCIYHYETALKSDPYFLKAYIQISKAFLENNDPQKAINYIEKALNLFNNEPNEAKMINNVLIANINKSESPIKYSKCSKTRDLVIYDSIKSQFKEEDKIKLVELANEISSK